MLADEIEYDDGIQIALLMLEGESSSKGWDFLGSQSEGSTQRLCCNTCSALDIKIKLNPKGRPKAFCAWCNDFVAVSLSHAAGSKATSTKNQAVSRPLADKNMVIGDPKTLSRQAVTWLHWGHGSLYRGDRALSKRVLESICYDLWVDVTSNHKDVFNRCNRLFQDDPQQKIYLMFWRVAQLSQVGQTFSASKVATYIGKHRKLLMVGTPGGDLMELIRSKLNGYELEVQNVFQID